MSSCRGKERKRKKQKNKKKKEKKVWRRTHGASNACSKTWRKDGRVGGREKRRSRGKKGRSFSII
jgi:hypothetical protein